MSVKIRGLFSGYGKNTVLKNIELAIDKGELVSLVGTNGAGKSTLLKCMNRIIKPLQGRILLEGKDASRMHLKEIAHFFGYVPQSALHIFPATVFDTVLLGRRPFVNWSVGPENRAIVYEVLSRMNLENMAHRQFNELSGGERQRVLIARALAQQPRVLLLDEPTSNLDIRHQLEVLDIMASIVKEKGVSVVMAIHDLNMAARCSDRIVFLRNGEVKIEGRPEDVLVSENIRSVFGVETIVNNDSGNPFIVPVGIVDF